MTKEGGLWTGVSLSDHPLPLAFGTALVSEFDSLRLTERRRNAPPPLLSPGEARGEVSGNWEEMGTSSEISSPSPADEEARLWKVETGSVRPGVEAPLECERARLAGATGASDRMCPSGATGASV
jgi:hypothetical protein